MIWTCHGLNNYRYHNKTRIFGLEIKQKFQNKKLGIFTYIIVPAKSASYDGNLTSKTSNRRRGACLAFVALVNVLEVH